MLYLVLPTEEGQLRSLNTEYLIIITQYMTCDIHLTDTTHCPERVFTTHNSTPHERKVDTEDMTAKGTRNSTLNILVTIQPLRYKIVFTSETDNFCLWISLRTFYKYSVIILIVNFHVSFPKTTRK